ncbi:MAG: hypothetical protein HOP19_17160 [Acidobacteria bacterium]|nr:hypothetical protein [Acidobacteriota bacterium]
MGQLKGRINCIKYDALGRRIERTSTTGEWQRYSYDGMELRSEENSDGTWVSYVDGNEFDEHLWHGAQPASNSSATK